MIISLSRDRSCRTNRRSRGTGSDNVSRRCADIVNRRIGVAWGAVPTLLDDNGGAHMGRGANYRTRDESVSKKPGRGIPGWEAEGERA